MSSLRLKFEFGFGQAIKKNRLANLHSIDQLLNENSGFLILKANNIDALYKATLELESFFVNNVQDPKSFAHLLANMKKSARVLLSRLNEGKIHKGSAKGLASSIEKLRPELQLILAQEMTNKSEE